MILIKSIDQLRDYVRINRSKDFASYKPYIIDAQQKYILPYFGQDIITALAQNNGDPLYSLICSALAPFSLAMATPEIALNFGESGLTVTKTDTQAPASEAKIERAVQSLMERAFVNLDIALKFVAQHRGEYPAWTQSSFAQRLTTVLFPDAATFQIAGNIDIDYSPLTFHTLIPLIRRIELTETMHLIPKAVQDQVIGNTLAPSLLSLLQSYTASRVGSVITSKESRTQRGRPRTLTDYSAITRPLFENLEADENFYQSQAEAFKNAIFAELIALGLINPDNIKFEWNEQDKKIFTSIS